MSTTSAKPAMVPPPSGWRLKLGFVLVVSSLFSAAFIPVIAALPLSTELKATISGLLVFGIPQCLMVLAVILVGKSGFAYIKDRVFGSFKRLAPPQTVSRTRYRIGLVMFCLPLVLAFVGPYADALMLGLGASEWQFGLIGDVLFVASFLVLGGDFWDKLRALFIHDARVQVSRSSAAQMA